MRIGGREIIGMLDLNMAAIACIPIGKGDDTVTCR